MSALSSNRHRSRAFVRRRVVEAEYDRIASSASDAPVPAAAPGPVLTTLAVNPAATPSQLPSDVLRLDLDLREDRDPGMVYARGQLRDAMDKYAALRTQIQTAQIDLETAQSCVKYRYSVVTPAHLPKSPTNQTSLSSSRQLS